MIGLGKVNIFELADLDIEVNGIWTNDIMTPIVGQQQTSSASPYLLQSIPLNSYAGSGVRFRFRGEYGTAFTGDIAIDDIALQSSSVPLPVELVSFDGKQLENGYNSLEWSTASEQGAEYFELERSTDGRTFAPIAKVMAQGAISKATAYAHVDFAPKAGENYYRLRMVDLDQSEEFSSIVVLATHRGEKNIELFPNPVNASLTVRGADQNDVVEIQNHLGQQLMSIPLENSGGQYFISTSSLPAGLYALRILSPTGAVKTIRKLQVVH